MRSDDGSVTLDDVFEQVYHNEIVDFINRPKIWSWDEISRRARRRDPKGWEEIVGSSPTEWRPVMEGYRNLDPLEIHRIIFDWPELNEHIYYCVREIDFREWWAFEGTPGVFHSFRIVTELEPRLSKIGAALRDIEWALDESDTRKVLNQYEPASDSLRRAKAKLKSQGLRVASDGRLVSGAGRSGGRPAVYENTVVQSLYDYLFPRFREMWPNEAADKWNPRLLQEHIWQLLRPYFGTSINQVRSAIDNHRQRH